AGEQAVVFLTAEQAPLRVGRRGSPRTDGAPEAGAGQRQTQLEAGALDLHVPALDADLAILDVGIAQHLVHRVAQAHFLFTLRGFQVVRGVDTTVVFILTL